MREETAVSWTFFYEEIWFHQICKCIRKVIHFGALNPNSKHVQQCDRLPSFFYKGKNVILWQFTSSIFLIELLPLENASKSSFLSTKNRYYWTASINFQTPEGLNCNYVFSPSRKKSHSHAMTAPSFFVEPNFKWWSIQKPMHFQTKEKRFLHKHNCKLRSVSPL